MNQWLTLVSGILFIQFGLSGCSGPEEKDEKICMTNQFMDYRDQTFGSNGRAIIDFGVNAQSSSALSLSLENDAATISGYRVLSTGRDPFVARININGQLDHQFGVSGSGIEVPDIGMNNQQFQDHVRLADGKLIAIAGNPSGFTLVAFLLDGRVDTTFGASGLLSVAAGVPIDTFKITADSEQRIIVMADHASHPLLWRFLSNGETDFAFGDSGRAEFEFDTPFHTRNVVTQVDDKILVVGSQTKTSVYWLATVLRVNENGTRDVSFGSANANGVNDGTARLDTGMLAEFWAVTVASNGDIVAVGKNAQGLTAMSTDALIARFDSAGKIQTSFGNSGFVLRDVENRFNTAESVAMDQMGRIVYAGTTDVSQVTTIDTCAITNAMSVGRLTPTGQADGDFGEQGFRLSALAVGETGQGVADVKVDSTGRILLAGYRYEKINGTNTSVSKPVVVRLLQNKR